MLTSYRNVGERWLAASRWWRRGLRRIYERRGQRVVFEVPLADWLVPFLLLALRERDWCGYELVQQMSDLDFGPAPPGDVYQALQQMVDEGSVVSEPQGLDGEMSRWRFSITRSGEDHLQFWADSLGRYQEEIDLFFRAYAGKTA